MTCCKKRSDNKQEILRLNFQDGELPSIHPHLIQGHMRGRILGKALYESLTRIGNEGIVEYAGAIGCKISDCKTQYTFTLRSQKWSDGAPVTAFQYEKAWKSALALAADCPRADLFYVIKNAEQAKKGEVTLDAVGIRALDSETLFVELAEPAPYFLELLAHPIFAPVDGDSIRFNGPFLIKKWVKDDFLLLEVNPHFWDFKNVKLKNLKISFITDPSTTMALYEKGELDWVGNPIDYLPAEIVLSLQTKGTLQQKEVARPFWIYLNCEHPALRSHFIRKAFSQAIDRLAITQHILIGAIPLNTPLPPSISLCTDQDRSLGQEKQLFEKGLKELDLTHSAFPPLTLSYWAGSKNLAEYLKACWEKAFGITINLKGSEWNVFSSQLENNQFHIGGCYTSAFHSDPIELLERFEDKKTCNMSSWISTIFQEKVALARKESNVQVRQQALREAEQILLNEVPYIPLCNPMNAYQCHPKLRGCVFDIAGCVDFRWAYFEW